MFLRAYLLIQRPSKQAKYLYLESCLYGWIVQNREQENVVDGVSLRFKSENNSAPRYQTNAHNHRPFFEKELDLEKIELLKND